MYDDVYAGEIASALRDIVRNTDSQMRYENTPTVFEAEMHLIGVSSLNGGKSARCGMEFDGSDCDALSAFSSVCRECFREAAEFDASIVSSYHEYVLLTRNKVRVWLERNWFALAIALFTSASASVSIVLQLLDWE